MQVQTNRFVSALFWTAVIGGLISVGFLLVFPFGPERPAEEDFRTMQSEIQSPSPQLASAQSMPPSVAPALVVGQSARDDATVYGIDSSPDLFAFSVAAADSTDPNKWAQGFAAVAECMAVKEDRNRYEELSAQAPSSTAAKRASAAATLVMNRCRGFLNNDGIANAALRRQMATNIRSGKEYVVGISIGPLDRSQFKSILQRKDYLTFGYIWSEVLGPSLRMRNLREADPHAIAFSIGYWMAQCDIGGDCSSNSFRYAQMCAKESVCENSLEANYLRDLPQYLRDEVSNYRQGIAQAFREKDTAFFGIN